MSEEKPNEPAIEKPNEEANNPADPPEAGQSTQNSMELATKVAERLDAKMKEMEEKEAAIDKKIKDFDSFVKATEIEGQTLAGQAPKTEEQKAQEETKGILAETGLDPFAGEGKKALD